MTFCQLPPRKGDEVRMISNATQSTIILDFVVWVWVLTDPTWSRLQQPKAVNCHSIYMGPLAWHWPAQRLNIDSCWQSRLLPNRLSNFKSLLVCMSFFTSSSGFTITGGNFTSISLPTRDAGGFYFQCKPYYWQALNTAATQVLGKTKDSDSCEFDDYYAQADGLPKRRRCRSLDGLMVCQQAITVILFHDHAFAIIDCKDRRSRPA